MGGQGAVLVSTPSQHKAVQQGGMETEGKTYALSCETKYGD